jgi:IS605 OrfB family transposase
VSLRRTPQNKTATRGPPLPIATCKVGTLLPKHPAGNTLESYRHSRKVLGEPANVTVSHSCGRWYLSVQTEREVEIPVHSSTSSVGLDWGIANFLTPFKGEPFQSLSPLKQNATKLARFARRLARKKKFSSNWKRLRAKISKLHQHIANARKDFVHKASHDISKNHAVVCVEDLQVKNMSKSAKGTQERPGQNVKKKSGLNRSILDASPFELRRQLEYKTLWSGGWLVAVPPQNTSRHCPACGHTAKENRKTQALFSCLECGFSAHADWVAARNIEEAGLALLACSQSSGRKPVVSGTHRSAFGTVGILGLEAGEDVKAFDARLAILSGKGAPKPKNSGNQTSLRADLQRIVNPPAIQSNGSSVEPRPERAQRLKESKFPIKGAFPPRHFFRRCGLERCSEPGHACRIRPPTRPRSRGLV